MDNNDGKGVINKGILNNYQELINNTASQLVGLEISEASQRLGYWWVLESQHIRSSGSQYTFTRAGVGKVTLYTDGRNTVVQTSLCDNWGDKRKKKIKADKEFHMANEIVVKPKTQDELMQKVEAALKVSNSNEERKDDKWGLFRGLEVTPLSQNMIDLLYDKDDVTEEMMEFVIEQTGEEFEYGEIDFTNMVETVYYYLENLEQQTAKKELNERAEKELSLHIQTLRAEIIAHDNAISDDKFLIKAYGLTIMNEMLIYLQDTQSLDSDELKALLTLEKPLDYLYDSWIDCDVNIKDGIIDVVSDTANRLRRNLEDAEQALESEYEDEDDMEI